MTYRTILLHLHDEAQAPALVKFASSVASQYGAHLIGLFVIHPFQIYVGRAGGLAASVELPTLLAKEQLERMKRMHAVFEKETKNQEHVAEWRFIDERAYQVADTMLQEATTADLLIIGHQTDNRFTQEIASSAMLASPVPVLVVPENSEIASFGHNILIAWDGKREAARAVVGARPILQRADNVWVHHVRTSIEKSNIMDSNMNDLAENLSRHGIHVEISESASDQKDVGSSISGVIGDHSVDCVVMGAYGHSNIRNLLLGSTTDYALKKLKVPLLMWH